MKRKKEVEGVRTVNSQILNQGLHAWYYDISIHRHEGENEEGENSTDIDLKKELTLILLMN